MLCQRTSCNSSCQLRSLALKSMRGPTFDAVAWKLWILRSGKATEIPVGPILFVLSHLSLVALLVCTLQRRGLHRTNGSVCPLALLLYSTTVSLSRLSNGTDASMSMSAAMQVVSRNEELRVDTTEFSICFYVVCACLDRSLVLSLRHREHIDHVLSDSEIHEGVPVSGTSPQHSSV